VDRQILISFYFNISYETEVFAQKGLLINSFSYWRIQNTPIICQQIQYVESQVMRTGLERRKTWRNFIICFVYKIRAYRKLSRVLENSKTGIISARTQNSVLTLPPSEYKTHIFRLLSRNRPKDIVGLSQKSKNLLHK
jgi:hypothetical protein